MNLTDKYALELWGQIKKCKTVGESWEELSKLLEYATGSKVHSKLINMFENQHHGCGSDMITIQKLFDLFGRGSMRCDICKMYNPHHELECPKLPSITNELDDLIEIKLEKIDGKLYKRLLKEQSSS